MVRPFSRVAYIGLAVATVALGLWIHWRAPALSDDARDVLGDAIWAGMITWWVGAMMPRASLLRRVGVALGISVAVEFSQLLHGPAIDAIRSTMLGQLVLGSGFDPRDLAAYAGGIAAAAALECAALRSIRTFEARS